MREPGRLFLPAMAAMAILSCTGGKALHALPPEPSGAAGPGPMAKSQRPARIGPANAASVRQLAAFNIPGYSRVSGSQCSVAFSPDGTLLACAAGRSSLPVWELPAGTLRFSLQTDPTHEVAVAFNPDGSELLVGGAAGIVRVFDTGSGAQLRALDPLASAVWDLAFDPAGGRLASPGFRSGLHVLDYPSGKTAWESAEGSPGAYFLSVDFSPSRGPSGDRIALGKTEDGVEILDARDGRIVASLPIGANVGDVAYSPDGRLLATGSDDGLARLWDTADNTLALELAGHAGYVNGVAFSTDGSLLATGSHDGTVGLWDVSTGRRLATLQGHGQPVLRLAFSPDGTSLASVGWDGTVRLWGASD